VEPAGDAAARPPGAPGDRGRPVPADVLKGPHRAVAPPDHKHRHPGDLGGEVVPGPGHVAGQGDDGRLAAEPAGPLGGEVVFGHVVGGRDPVHGVGHDGGALGLEGQDLGHQPALGLGPHQADSSGTRLVQTKDTARDRSRKPSAALNWRWSCSLGK